MLMWLCTLSINFASMFVTIIQELLQLIHFSSIGCSNSWYLGDEWQRGKNAKVVMTLVQKLSNMMP